MSNTSSNNPAAELVEAADLLWQAHAIAAFVHSIGLDGPVGQVIELNDEQTSGFCVVMRDMMDRIEKSEKLVTNALHSLGDKR